MIINTYKFLQRGRILKSDFEAGGLKINQCEAARFPECAASHFTYPARSGNPQDLVDGIMGREGAPQQVEIVRKPVQPDQRRGVDAVSGVGTERGAFGAPADGAAHVAHRHHGVSARNREFINRFQNLLHGVDAPFEPCNGLRVQRSDLVAPRLPRGQQRLDRHQPRKNAVQVADRRRQRSVAAHVVGQQSRESSQFVDRTVSLDPFVGLEDPLAADQRGHSLVARFRVYLHILKCCFGKWLLKISR